MRSPDLRAVILQSALKHLAPEARVAVALSGGIDSVVLLHALAAVRADLPIEVLAIHINHGLSPNAAAWEKQCFHWCGENGIRFAARRLALKPIAGESLEAVARRARYRELESAAAAMGVDALALAHHIDDQAETVLLQLLRGGSAKSLAAMPAWREGNAGIACWRPLLASTRESIAVYARENRLAWIEDESNADVRFKRNFLRREILPGLEAGFPGYRAALSRSAARAAESDQLAEDLARIDGQGLADPCRLPAAYLSRLGPLRARNLLRHVLHRDGFVVPNADRLAEFVRQVSTASTDRHPALALDGRRVLRLDRGVVAVFCAAQAEPFHAVWRQESEIRLPHGTLQFTFGKGVGIDAGRIPVEGLVIRPRVGGERCRTAANRPTRTLKNLLQEARIPAALRNDWPLMVSGDRLVAVPGVAVDSGWRCSPERTGWAVSWLPSVD